MIRTILCGLLSSTILFLFGQKPSEIISRNEVERIERFLSSDELKGRRTGSEGIQKASVFLQNELKQAGLSFFPGLHSYAQQFKVLRPQQAELSASWNGSEQDPKKVLVLTTKEKISVNHTSGFEIRNIKPGENLLRTANQILVSGKNTLVWVDESFSSEFPRLAGLKRQLFEMSQTVIFCLQSGEPAVFSVTASHTFQVQHMENVVGVLPGKSKPDEYVIFSAHYDHVGVGKPINGDSIYNGANDNAAGTTAVILLAKYFKSLASNERTLVFVAFDAEETGGYGSRYFSRQLNPDKVVAMFNIEMIGTESKWGKNSAFITGYEKSDLGSMMQKNLEGSGFTFHPDPYPEQNLFYRSDNATLARLGVPAHTISTAKMENEPHYHKVTDEIRTLDLDNMTKIIQSIAISARSVISGKDTPGRVKAEDLR